MTAKDPCNQCFHDRDWHMLDGGAEPCRKCSCPDWEEMPRPHQKLLARIEALEEKVRNLPLERR